LDYLPPGRVVKVCDPRWGRWLIMDGLSQYFAGNGRWSDNPSDAVLYCRELDAIAERNRCCLGDAGETFVAQIAIVTHAGRWSRKTLANFLKRHREFFIGGPAGKEGLLLEIVPDSLKKVEP
jgi:hypothetical protein